MAAASPGGGTPAKRVFASSSPAFRRGKANGGAGSLECGGSRPLSFFGAAGVLVVSSGPRPLKERKRCQATALQSRPARADSFSHNGGSQRRVDSMKKILIVDDE